MVMITSTKTVDNIDILWIKREAKTFIELFVIKKNKTQLYKEIN